MKRPFKIAILSVIVLSVLLQFIRPQRNSTDVISQNDISRHLEIPAEVKTLLARSCSDCHSDNTVWPWYSNIAPVSWLIAKDVKSGKKRLNFSTWEEYSDMQKISKFVMICEMVSTGKMPILAYKMMHKEARLTEKNKKTICAWAEKQIEIIGKK